MKKISKGILAAVLLSSTVLLHAQTFRDSLVNGKVNGQVRYYYMQADNEPGLQDYYGHTIGGKLKYVTQEFNGFSEGVAFYTTNFINTNVKSGNTEPLAGNKNSRYVIGLVDATNPDNHGVTGVGELYLNYRHSKTDITIGRMKLNTPFMNPEDGRMIPTLEQGVWIKSADVDDFILQGGMINAFWNRSTPGFKSVQDSIGYGYGEGIDPMTGKPSHYLDNIKSDGLYVVSALYKGLPGTKLQAWNYYAQNLFNMAYAQADNQTHFGAYRMILGAQFAYETAVGDGGNPDPALTYMRRGEVSQTYGAKIGAGYKGSVVSFAYNMTTSAGRMMFPREWGKEPLFTFQKRERSEGSGGCHAWLVTLQQNFKQFGIDGLRAKIGFGEYFKADVKDTVLNKYALPSYAQSNVDIFYNFKGALKGFSLEYLFARKYALGDTYGAAKYIFEKVNINVHNLIINYNF
jgi:hypothetical protein